MADSVFVLMKKQPRIDMKAYNDIDIARKFQELSPGSEIFKAPLIKSHKKLARMSFCLLAFLLLASTGFPIYQWTNHSCVSNKVLATYTWLNESGNISISNIETAPCEEICFNDTGTAPGIGGEGYCVTTAAKTMTQLTFITEIAIACAFVLAFGILTHIRILKIFCIYTSLLIIIAAFLVQSSLASWLVSGTFDSIGVIFSMIFIAVIFLIVLGFMTYVYPHIAKTRRQDEKERKHEHDEEDY